MPCQSSAEIKQSTAWGNRDAAVTKSRFSTGGRSASRYSPRLTGSISPSSRLIELIPTKTPSQRLAQAELAAVLAEQGLEMCPRRYGETRFRQIVTTYQYLVTDCLIPGNGSSNGFVEDKPGRTTVSRKLSFTGKPWQSDQLNGNLGLFRCIRP